ncbi:PREDICTED: uncharacterized protein LOC109329226 [Lupinus angustifolius]|uniref:uncharacterized protein LOC109329226 n=1 Tax=Lupinus angustifolius TaxID=3871 RepID=UPI00092F25AF|nr:PREDICTED: uncharacterized protein LOC109329226 [Lupinus angustifolius]
MWEMIGPWSMVSLGKGYYDFSFSSVEDMRSICAVGAWSLKPSFLRMSLWTPDFNPSQKRHSHSQCWVKIFGLPQEYWSPRILFSIAGGLGTPISLDDATSKRSFGHYALVLVEVNIREDLHEQILVEREGFAFFVGIEYENVPPYCTSCNSIGHVQSNCRRLTKKKVEENAPRKKAEESKTKTKSNKEDKVPNISKIDDFCHKLGV